MNDKEHNNMDNSIIAQLKSIARKAGVRVVYSSLLLYYAYSREETPRWAKNIILGAFGYLLSPIDLIPDLTPFIGFTDDFGVLAIGLSTISLYINEDVREKAKNKTAVWFPNLSRDDLEDINQQIDKE